MSDSENEKKTKEKKTEEKITTTKTALADMISDIVSQKIDEKLQEKEGKKSSKKSSKSTVIRVDSEDEDEDSGDNSLEYGRTKKEMVSIKAHPYLKFSGSLGSSKFAKLIELKHFEIQTYILAYIQKYYGNKDKENRIECYITFLYELSQIVGLERYSSASLDLISHYAIDFIDTKLLRTKKCSKTEVETEFAKLTFRHAVEVKNSFTKSASSGMLSNNKQKPKVKLCFIWNANKSCSDDCTYDHSCKICWEKDRKKENHMPKDCPRKKNKDRS